MTSDTPVTFRHTLDALSRQLHDCSVKRRQRHMEFSDRIHELITRYERVTSSRLHRLAVNGIEVNRVNLREYAREKTFAAQEARHERDPNQLQIITLVAENNKSKGNKDAGFSEGTVLHLDESNEPKITQGHRTSTRDRHSVSSRYSRRYSVPASQQTHGRTHLTTSHRHHVNEGAHHPPEPTHTLSKRHSVILSAIPGKEGPIAEQPETCSLHTTCAIPCRGRTIGSHKAPEKTEKTLFSANGLPTATGARFSSFRHDDVPRTYKFQKVVSTLTYAKRFQAFRSGK